MKYIRYLVILAFAVLSASPVLAQSNQNTQGMQGMQGMQGQDSMQSVGHMKVMGMHQMRATVTSVNMSTGIMEVTSDGMKLRLYFPPASLAAVKAGDNITLRMGFMKQ